MSSNEQGTGTKADFTEQVEPVYESAESVLPAFDPIETRDRLEDALCLSAALQAMITVDDLSELGSRAKRGVSLIFDQLSDCIEYAKDGLPNP